MTFLSNERIPYIVCYDVLKSNAAKSILSDVVEHPDYLEGKKIDYLYYLVK